MSKKTAFGLIFVLLLGSSLLFPSQDRGETVIRSTHGYHPGTPLGVRREGLPGFHPATVVRVAVTSDHPQEGFGAMIGFQGSMPATGEERDLGHIGLVWIGPDRAGLRITTRHGPDSYLTAIYGQNERGLFLISSEESFER
jgi:hypothetical protein